MKILMTTDCTGGVWSYTLELCRALAEQDCEVILVSLGERLGAAARQEAAGLPNVALHESDYRLEWMEDPWLDVEHSARFIDRLARSRGADLLHFNSYGPASYAHELPSVLVAHSCVNSRHRATRGTRPKTDLERYRKCVVGALRRADSVIAPTGAFLACLAETYGEADFGGRSRVIHNGIDPFGWPRKRSIGSSFVLGVGCVSDEGKNLSQLARVAPDLPCAVLIAGDGDLPERPARLRVLGTQSRKALASYYRIATVFAHPARYEPFGLAVLEAALCGCPLMLADIPSLREVWGAAAQYADPDDTGAWRDGLRALLRDAGLRSRLGRAAQRQARQYSAARMAAAYAESYRDVLRRPVEAVA